MQTRVSTKGQIVLPGPIRRRFDIRVGDKLDVDVRGAEIVLSTPRRKRGVSKIVTDPATGFPVLTAGSGAPVLTSREVLEALADFP